MDAVIKLRTKDAMCAIYINLPKKDNEINKISLYQFEKVVKLH